MDQLCDFSSFKGGENQVVDSVVECPAGGKAVVDPAADSGAVVDHRSEFVDHSNVVGEYSIDFVECYNVFAEYYNAFGEHSSHFVEYCNAAGGFCCGPAAGSRSCSSSNRTNGHRIAPQT